MLLSIMSSQIIIILVDWELNQACLWISLLFAKFLAYIAEVVFLSVMFG